ncbi:MAG: hypothetical protein VB111_09415 [Clostridiaceae bacterium]|nr:hypothetical protein [Clostridiaceae bacterium]
MTNGEVFIWMQLLGFERDDLDHGAARYLDQVGFTPDGIVALLYHPDFVHLHRGMDSEYTLFDDNCAYYGIPRNAERARQSWTNYDLRGLARALNARGVGLYASMMGAVNGSLFHDEWIAAHPEIIYTGIGRRGGMNVLKRFTDGTYYEDFFADRLVETLVDYELAGVQLADSFCPPPGTRAYGDFCTDMTLQFIEHTGFPVPGNVQASLGDDSDTTLTVRKTWLFGTHREAWIRFNAWRWECFYIKLAEKLHAAGKKLMVLGMYCTDPFETLYCIGVDLKRIAAAGVDCLCPNLLPTSVYMQSDFRSYFFHRYMTIAPLTAAYMPDTPLYSMLGVQDATEEWDVLHHAPTRFERDLYTEQSYRLETPQNSRRALTGYLLCLGDGIHAQDWAWMRDRFEIAFSADVEHTLSPAVLWSDTAFDAMLPSYIATRRWTVHKTVYELAKAGSPIGAAVRTDALRSYAGPLLVPCFDLLSDEERRAVAAYDRGPVVCTAAPGFDPAVYGIRPTVSFFDRHAAWAQTVFAYGFPVSDALRRTLSQLLDRDDGSPELTCAPEDAPEFTYTLIDTLSFQKVSCGFIDALACLMKAASGELFTADSPFTAYQLKNGAYRLYLYNTLDEKYHSARVRTARPILSASIVSRYPVLPVRYTDENEAVFSYNFDRQVSGTRGFITKLAPSGVTIVDVTLGAEYPLGENI